MKTKKRPSPKSESFTVGPVPEPEPIREENSETTKPVRERFQMSFDLNEDGSPDLTPMRERTKERVREFFSDPRMAAAFGVKPVTAAGPEVQIFHPMMVAGMYSVLGSVETMVAIRMGHIPEHIARQVFTYSANEVEVLTGPTVRVLNKYAAEWMIKYQDEIALATLLISMTINKVNTALLMAKAQGSSIMQSSSQEKNGESAKKDDLVQ